MQRPNIHEGTKCITWLVDVTCWVTPPTQHLKFQHTYIIYKSYAIGADYNPRILELISHSNKRLWPQFRLKNKSLLLSAFRNILERCPPITWLTKISSNRSNVQALHMRCWQNLLDRSLSILYIIFEYFVACFLMFISVLNRFLKRPIDSMGRGHLLDKKSSKREWGPSARWEIMIWAGRITRRFIE